MSISKALQFIDKKDLECAICLSRFHQPKTLKCMHTYCQQCIKKCVEAHGKIKCPTCGQEHDLTKQDLNKLPSNTLISDLLHYVVKTEDQKPTKCCFCDNQPSYHCSICQLYLCDGNCIKQHKALPSTKDHPLYTLDMKEQDGSSENETKCPADRNTTLEFYCSTCNKSACTKCKQQHKVITMSTARDQFNKDVTDVVKQAHEIEIKLTEKLQFIAKYKSEFDSQFKLCRKDIENHEKNLIKTVQEKSKELVSDLEEIYRESKEEIDYQIEDIDSKLTEVNNLKASINTMLIKATINKPEEQDSLGSYWANVKTVRDDFLQEDFNSSFTFSKSSVTPNFIPSTCIKVFTKEGIGRVSTVNRMTCKVAKSCEEIAISKDRVSTVNRMTCKFAKGHEEIAVTKGQSFVVKVSDSEDSDAHQLAATLKNSSDEESATKVEYQVGGEYKIRDQGNVKGEWQTVTGGTAHAKGSPVSTQVKTLKKMGLVKTTCNISKYKEHNKTREVTDVLLDRDGCILVSSLSKDILKFNQQGSFVAKIQVAQDVKVNSMYQLGDGHILYSDFSKKCVVMCDDQFKEIRHLFGKGVLKDPCGLAVNMENSALYVADFKAHCVFKFNVDDGTLMSKLGSEGNKEGHLQKPTDVTLTKENYVVVADYGNHRIQMFDANGNWMRIIADCGKKNGQILSPCGLTMDMNENIIISSNNKLQLFDKNGVFIKRIDHEDDGLKFPYGVTIIPKSPRKVVVANHGANNVKIFYY
ncbi:tripartite motif-containing protein 3-like [Anneissia japonica]|uniref:tripartite motif-containing protein 3-like n=1 Tax=Anneissia japonica TaxID=1529436 RepID=UPI0014258728|nr:tripartite motif-containing protein 3-like [Anneissia japonica]